MNENLLALLAVLGVVQLLTIAGIFALCGWILKTFSREMLRHSAQADERVTGSWSLVERAMSRITAIHFPESHERYRRSAGPVLDGAQQRSRAHYVDEVAAANEHVARANGTAPIIPGTEIEPGDELP